MTSMNGSDTLHADAIPPDVLAKVRAEVLIEQRQAIYKEREMLTVRRRVQSRIGAAADVLEGLDRALEQCELALLELDIIEAEWRQS